MRTEQNIKTKSKSSKSEEFQFRDSTEAIYLFNLDGQIVQFNNALCNMFDYSAEEIPKIKIFDLHPRDEIKRIREIVDNIDDYSSGFKSEIKCIRKNGSEFDAEINWKPILSYDEGRVAGFLKDITESNKIKQALAATRENYKAIFENSPDAIMLIDSLGQVLELNKTAEEWFGYSSDEISGSSILQIPFIERQSQIDAYNRFSSYSVVEENSTLIIKCIPKKGEKMICELVSHRINDKKGRQLFDMIWISDITEKVNAKVELEDSKKRYRILTESAPEMILTYNSEMKIKYANQSLLHIAGFNEKEIFKYKIDDLFKSNQNFSKFSSDSGIKLFESMLKSKSGKEIPVELSKIDFSINENENEILIIARDITDRKFAEKALQSSEERFRELYNNSNLGIYQRAISGKFLLANPALLKFYGVENISELNNCKLSDFYPDKSRLKESIKQLNDEGRIHGYEFQCKSKKGETYYLRENARLVSDDDGNPIYYEGTCEDITINKKAEKELESADLILKAVSFSAERFLRSKNWDDEIASVLDRLGRATNSSRVYIMKNSAKENGELTFSQIFEWTEENVSSEIEDPIWQNIRYDELGFNDLKEVLSSREYLQDLVKDIPNNFGKLLLQWDTKSILIFPIFLKDEFWGFLAFDECKFERIWSNREVEAIKTAAETLSAAIYRDSFEKELIKAKEEAEKSDKFKSEFLTQMSHEIRTPINAILSFAELVKDEVFDIVDDDLKSVFPDVDAAGKRITRTIDLILNMSEIQTNQYEMRLEKFDLVEDVLAEIYVEHMPYAMNKNLEFNINNETKDSTIIADRYSLAQILINLIDNAIKYTKVGNVDVTIKEETNNIICEINDTGIGIADEYLSMIYSAFTQEESGYTRKFEGNGLGLALTKRYCEMNHIDITIRTKKNEGTTFFLTIPKRQKNKHESKR